MASGTHGNDVIRATNKADVVQTVPLLRRSC